MELREVLRKRKSVRHFDLDRPVTEDQLNEIIVLASSAPSAGGMKSYTVLTANELPIRVKAPVYLVIFSNSKKLEARYGARGRDLYALEDATIFGAYTQLIAVDMGLSSVWIGAFKENKIKRIMKVEDHLRPIAIIAFGYEKDEEHS